MITGKALAGGNPSHAVNHQAARLLQPKPTIAVIRNRGRLERLSAAWAANVQRRWPRNDAENATAKPAALAANGSCQPVDAAIKGRGKDAYRTEPHGLGQQTIAATHASVQRLAPLSWIR